MTTQQLSESTLTPQEHWFENLIGSIRVDQLEIETNTATPEKQRLYENMMSGDPMKMIGEMRELSSKAIIELLIKDYMAEIKKGAFNIKKLAFDLSDSKVLVWAEIQDNDEKTENGLILTEATINAKFADFGFHVSTTYVESGDAIPVPNHYLSVTK
jgi:hypothetical protein